MKLVRHVSASSTIRYVRSDGSFELDHKQTKARIRVEEDGAVKVSSGTCSRTFVLDPGERKELEELIERGNVAAVLAMFPGRRERQVKPPRTAGNRKESAR